MWIVIKVHPVVHALDRNDYWVGTKGCSRWCINSHTEYSTESEWQSSVGSSPHGRLLCCVTCYETWQELNVSIDTLINAFLSQIQASNKLTCLHQWRIQLLFERFIRESLKHHLHLHLDPWLWYLMMSSSITKLVCSFHWLQCQFYPCMYFSYQICVPRIIPMHHGNSLSMYSHHPSFYKDTNHATHTSYQFNIQ